MLQVPESGVDADVEQRRRRQVDGPAQALHVERGPHAVQEQLPGHPHHASNHQGGRVREQASAGGGHGSAVRRCNGGSKVRDSVWVSSVNVAVSVSSIGEWRVKGARPVVGSKDLLSI